MESRSGMATQERGGWWTGIKKGRIDLPLLNKTTINNKNGRPVKA
jgi:hypothetical protein